MPDSPINDPDAIPHAIIAAWTLFSPSARRDPYFKHQVWKDGRNVSQRVPAAEAAQLREDTDNARRYEQLTGELARLNIEHTLALRAARSPAAGAGGAERNSARNRTSKGSPKRRPSWRRPGRP